MNRDEYHSAVAALPYGKRLPTAVYLFVTTEAVLPEVLCNSFRDIRHRLELGAEFNLLKFSTTEPKLSFLAYPHFDEDPHPALTRAVVVNLVTGKVRRDDYSGRNNPPILHRKELFVPADYPWREKFAHLTAAEEAVGILDDTARIGFKLNWERLLAEKGIAFRGHEIHRNTGSSTTPGRKQGGPRIAREKTAMVRSEASRPVRLLLESSQLRPGEEFFDYGCGHGADVASVRSLGFIAAGWDPHYAPRETKVEAAVVNLGYVLNVIEDPAERVETLLEAWRLARRLLVVSTLIAGEEGYQEVKRFGDGVLTKRATFQKYFEQGELQALLEESLQCEAVPVALGVFFVFREIAELHDFLAARSRRFVDWSAIARQIAPERKPAPRVDPYEHHAELLEAFWESALTLGRVPRDDEFSRLPDVRRACGSVPKAFHLLSDRFGAGIFEAARARRREDLLVYAAASQLRRRIPFPQLSSALQRDIRSYFGTYPKTEESARELLFASGDPDELELALSSVNFGEIDAAEGHFTFHRDLLDRLPGIMRVYVVCGARLYGDPKQADLIKIHLHTKKLTFLHYENFETKNFPALVQRIKIDLRRLFVTVFQYPADEQRQLLLFKHRYWAKDDPRRETAEKISGRLRQTGVIETGIGYGPTMADFAAWRAARGLDENLNAQAGKSCGAPAPLRVISKGRDRE